jgi:2'-5' RNA ligase
MPDPRHEIRVFVALPVTGMIQEAIRSFQEQAGPAAIRQVVRWTRPDHIHLTLKFLGATPADQLPEMTEALERAIGNTTTFPLEVAGLGCFPNARRPRIIWAGIGGKREALSALETNLTRALARWAAPDDRPFSPHLTIGRLRDLPPRDLAVVRAWIESHRAPIFGSWSATQLDLMRSDLTPTGAKYVRLATFPFNGAHRAA